MSQLAVAEQITKQTKKEFVTDERKGPSIIGRLTGGTEKDLPKIEALVSNGIRLVKYTN